MQIFISWSGRRSKAIALRFKDWIPLIIQQAQIWFSEDDVHKGSRWMAALGHQLTKPQLALLFVTQENVSSSWLLYEAGAIAHANSLNRIYPILIDTRIEDLPGPLLQFQCTDLEVGDIGKMMRSINRLMPHPSSDPIVDKLFDKFWPELEPNIQALRDSATATTQPFMLDRTVEQIQQNVIWIQDAIKRLQDNGKLGDTQEQAELNALSQEQVRQLNQYIRIVQFRNKLTLLLDRSISGIPLNSAEVAKLLDHFEEFASHAKVEVQRASARFSSRKNEA